MERKDIIVLIVCLLLVGSFVFLLPKLNATVRNHDDLNEELEKPEQIPISYHCTMTRQNEEYQYTLNQDATYTLDEDEKITKAVTKQTYRFEGEENYHQWIENNISNEQITGITKEINYDPSTFTINITTTRMIHEIPDDKLDVNFPKTYQNLLIYTKDQTCDVTYKEEKK